MSISQIDRLIAKIDVDDLHRIILYDQVFSENIIYKGKNISMASVFITLLDTVSFIFLRRVSRHTIKLCLNPHVVKVLNELNANYSYAFNVMYQKIKNLIWVYRFTGLSEEDIVMLDEILKQHDQTFYNKIMGISGRERTNTDQVLDDSCQCSSYYQDFSW